MSIQTGDRVVVDRDCLPEDWTSTGEVTEVTGQTIVVLLDNGHQQEVLLDQVTRVQAQAQCLPGGDTSYYDGMDVVYVTGTTSGPCSAGQHGECPASFPANQDQTCRICNCPCHASTTGSCVQGYHNPGGRVLHGACRGWVLRTCGSPALLLRDGTRTVDPAHGHDPVPCSCTCHTDARPQLAEAMAARDRGLTEQRHHQRLMLR